MSAVIVLCEGNYARVTIYAQLGKVVKKCGHEKSTKNENNSLPANNK